MRRVVWITLGFAAGLAARPVAYHVDANGLHVAGFTGDNPVLYDNDWWNDVTDGFYLWAKYQQGRVDLRGNVVTRDLWDWQGGYQYSLAQGLENARRAVALAQDSGLTRVPPPVAGCGTAFTAPASGRIKDTVPVSSPGSDLIVAEARRARPERPLVVFVGGPLNTVANALLQDPNIADRMIVCMTDLCGYNGKDPWANWIVARRCRLINYGAEVWWPQLPEPPVMPVARFDALPDTPLTREMRRIARMFRQRRRSVPPGRDDGFGDGAPIFLYFNPRTWTKVQEQRIEGVFRVRDAAAGQPYDVLDGRRCDYAAMTEDFFRTFTRP